MTVEHIMPSEAAALVLAWLEGRGAIITIEGDFVRVDLSPMTDFGTVNPDTLARALPGLCDEIREILIARRTVH